MNYNDINDEFDMENILHLNRRKPEVPNFFEMLNNRQFKSRFRLSKDVTISLINLINNKFTNDKKRGNVVYRGKSTHYSAILCNWLVSIDFSTLHLFPLAFLKIFLLKILRFYGL